MMSDDWKGAHLIRVPRRAPISPLLGQCATRTDQQAIAALAAKGHTRKEIAGLANLSEGRVSELAKRFKIDITPGYSKGQRQGARWKDKQMGASR
jgi:hypothetical protein